MKLTAVQIKSAQPEEKDYKLFDGGGLYLLVKTNGSKYWRYKYRINKKEKLYAFGTFPAISLKEVRELHIDVRRLVLSGIDPSAKLKEEKRLAFINQENTFEAIGRQWWDKEAEEWSAKHAARVLKSLELEVFPFIGNMPVNDITTADVLAVLNRVQERGALDVASRVQQRCASIFRFGVQIGKTSNNPMRDLVGVLKTRKVKHQASLSREELPGFLKSLEHYQGSFQTVLALKMLILTFVRPGELRAAKWDEFNFERMEWRIPGERMKMKTPHIVPISYQTNQLLDQLYQMNGQFDFVFPGERNKRQCMSENTMTQAIYKLGYKGRATGHGFRATASSILNEDGFNRDAIERQLAHIERNDVRAAYIHHAEYMDDRKHMMQWWADYLDQVRK